MNLNSSWFIEQADSTPPVPLSHHTTAPFVLWISVTLLKQKSIIWPKLSFFDNSFSEFRIKLYILESSSKLIEKNC